MAIAMQNTGLTSGGGLWILMVATIAVNLRCAATSFAPPSGSGGNNINQQRITDAVTKELNKAADNIIKTQATAHVNEAIARLNPNKRMNPQLGPGPGPGPGPNRMGPPGPRRPLRWRKRRDMVARNKAFRNHRVHRRRVGNGEQDYIDGWRM